MYLVRPRLIARCLFCALAVSCSGWACAATAISISISSNSDDADQDSGGSVKLDDAKIQLGQMAWNGLRFRNVSIPPGATILSAYVELTSETDKSESTDLTIFGENVDSAAMFTSSNNNISSRTRTVASVAWSNVPNWSTNQVYQTPELRDIVQEIVDRAGWSSGNNVVIVIRSDDANGNRIAWARDGSSSRAAELHVTYAVSSLVAHWKLDEASGPTAIDATGNGHDGSFEYGPILNQNAVRDRGALFDGANDRVLVPDDPVFSSHDTTGLTVAAWIKVQGFGTDGNSETRQPVASKGSTGDLEWAFYVYDNGEIGFTSWRHNGNNQSEVTGGAIEVGKWVHVAATYEDGVASRVYINGQQVAESTSFQGNPHDDTGPLLIGALADGQYLNAVIDDVRFYNVALTASEIVDIYGLVGHWTFDEGAGTTIADSSPNANDATFNTGTPNWITGVYGSALEFDGASDAITATDFDPPAEGTVALWIRSNGPPAGRHRPWGVGADYEMWQDTDGLVSMDVSTDGFQGGFITTVPLYTPGRWYHIAAVYDSDDDSYQIYLNGQLHKSGTSTWDITQQLAAQLSFGTRTGSTQRFTGAIDDFRIYSYKLSATDIAELFGLVGHWKLDEGSGTIATDSSAAGNDGTHSGGVTTSGAGPYPGVGSVAAEFDGIDDETDLPDMDYDFSQGLSIALWAKPTTALAAGQYQAFLDLSNGTDVDQIWFGWVGVVGLQLYLTDTQDGSSLRTIEDNTDFQTDEWVHCVVTVDSSGNATLYRNGQVTKTGFYTSLPTCVSRTMATLGSSPLGDRLSGGLFDVRVYRRGLSHAEVADIYGLVGYWKLDEVSGLVATDTSGSGLHGVYINDPTLAATSKSPSLGTAVDFSGASQYVDLPDMQFDFSRGITTAGWIKPSSAPGAFYSIFSISNGQSIDDVWLGWSLGNGMQGWFTDLHDTSGYRVINDADDPNLNSWHHCVVSVDSDGNATLYRDGVATAWTYIGNSNDNLRTGNFIATSVWNDPCIGTLDDIRLYNRAVSAAEAAAMQPGGGSAGLRIIRWVEIP